MASISAVDGHDDAVDHGRLVREQIDDGVRDLLGLCNKTYVFVTYFTVLLYRQISPVEFWPSWDHL